MILVGRLAIVITIDEPETNATERVRAILSEFQPALDDQSDVRVWLGIRESAEAIMKVTGELHAGD